jgi:endonuclease YncB( thermonuclease family)
MPAADRDRARLRPFSVALLAFVVLVTPGTTRAEPPRTPPVTPPIWSDVPVLVDRAKETRERIAPAPTALPVPGFRVTGARGEGTGALRIDGIRHRLFGLAPIDPERICTDADGRRWACGLRARSTLSGLAVGHTLRCRRIDGSAPSDPVVDCRYRNRSLSERLIAEGLADLDDDGRADPILAAAVEAARRARRGLWAADPPP